jgi:hypothetical protein
VSNLITVTTPACQVCSKTSEFTLDDEKVDRWKAGAYIQDVWPHMTMNDRELLISGTHPKCWEELFAEEDE